MRQVIEFFRKINIQSHIFFTKNKVYMYKVRYMIDRCIHMLI